ncbi:hypothetical protein QMZ93_07210 [Pantoea stewartii subsp. indologenes]|uniref:hypothetical protein n=1 Tax=Pantoea stewartii TaxID=66269 RepID=UPI0024DF980C|nr:hypothetical protein [Pantoea stewartii]MDK2633130.1 hypothetical protein [Pantoea stewartii subsp. indologenes]
MTLLELLVQELPKRGGWPESACVAKSYSHIPDALFWDDNGITVPFHSLTRLPIGSYCVTREQYESAIAASKQPEWNGEGLPPVGCECELFDCDTWNPVIIKFVGEKYVVTERTDLGYEVVYCLAERPERFRTSRTEEERKRKESIASIYKNIGIMARDGGEQAAIDIYVAIAAGKIPGIRLTDEAGD